MNGKNTIIIAALSVLLAACTMNPIEPVSPTPQGPEVLRSYIFFEPEIVNSVVKKSDPLYYEEVLPGDANTAFGALGYYNGNSLFTEYENGIANVYRPEEDAPFEYDNLAAWQHLTNKHQFYGFYPYSLLNTVTENDGDPFITYSLPEVNNMLDILIAYVQTSKQNPVVLSFGHALWALDVEVKITQENNPYNPDGTAALAPSLTIKKVVLYMKNIPSSGKLYLDGDSDVNFNESGAPICSDKVYTLFEASTGTPAITIPYTDAEGTPINSVTFDPLLFFPTDVQIDDTHMQYRLELTLANSWGEEYTFQNPTSGYKNFGVTTFDAGKRYKLSVNKTDDPEFNIGFSIQGWGEPVRVDHTFN